MIINPTKPPKKSQNGKCVFVVICSLVVLLLLLVVDEIHVGLVTVYVVGLMIDIFACGGRGVGMAICRSSRICFCSCGWISWV